MDQKSCDRISAFFGVFSSPTRMQMFCAMTGGAKTVGELAEAAKTSGPNVSQHLRLMKSAGVVRTERDGHFIRCRIADPRFIEAARLVRDALSGEPMTPEQFDRYAEKPTLEL